MKVAYMPPILDIGPNPQHIQLVLSVTNHLGRTVTGICFNITVMPVDNQPPQVGSYGCDRDSWWQKSQCQKCSGCFSFQVVTNALIVDEGRESPLSSPNLLLSDVDSREEVLQVQLKTGPQHGALRIGPLPLEKGGIFTVKDLKSLKMRSDVLLLSLLCFMNGQK